MAPPCRQTTDAEDGRQARDVMAFGQEIGRVLSDGRIIGRAEPFAKVFPSSRGVKRAVGLVAWGVLEDVALDARLDDRGRLVAETNVRRIATNLGLSKTTVQKHLTVLRDLRLGVSRGAARGRVGPLRAGPLRHRAVGMHRAVHHRAGATDPAARRWGSRPRSRAGVGR